MTDVFTCRCLLQSIELDLLMTATSLNQCSDTSRVTKRKQDN